MTKETELVALERNLREAMEALKRAELAEAAARRERCDAQNLLNTAQKQFDAHLVKLRQEAPRESDWGRARDMKKRVAA